MKEKYIKPELETQPYAQFENVYAGCNKTVAKAQHCSITGGHWPHIDLRCS